MSEHTKWIATEGDEYTTEVWTDDSPGSVRIAACYGINRRENAAKIVRAVNSHAELVEALEKTLPWLWNASISGGWAEKQKAAHNLWNDAKLALSRAKGEA